MKEYMRPKEALKSGLHELCVYVVENSKAKNLYAAEIGSYAGESAVILAQYVSKLYCVDPWTSDSLRRAVKSRNEGPGTIEKSFDERVAGVPNVIKEKGYSPQIADSHADSSLHLVYIDAEHTRKAVQSDIKAWWPKLKRSGFIAGHDYNSRTHPGVVDAVDAELGKPDKVFSDTSWIKAVS